MIEVAKILEGGIDLRTGEAEPKALVLLNGDVECLLPVNDQQIAILIDFLARSVVAASPPPPPKPPSPMPRLVEPPAEDDGYNDPETGVASF